MPTPRAVSACLALLVLAPAAMPAPQNEDVVRRIVDDTNTLRRSQGLRSLNPQPQLAAAAHAFAQHMARSDRYGHEADGRDPAQRVREQGYDYCFIAENIAFQYSSVGFAPEELARAFVQGWRRSPPHWRNMLAPDATDTGVAVARSPRSGHYYAVQLFGRPQALHVAFRITNRSTETVRYEIDGRNYALPPRTTDTHTQCTTPRLVVQLPGQKPAVVQPSNGERYAVERAKGRYVLTRG